jgi:hypothetical protein
VHRRILLFFFIVFAATDNFAQITDSLPVKDSVTRSDSVVPVQRNTVNRRNDTARPVQTITNNTPVPNLPDTVHETIQDTIQEFTTIKRPVIGTPWELDNSFPVSLAELNRQILNRHPYFGFTGESLNPRSDIRQFSGKEIMFYVLIALLLVFALLREAFPKYFNDLFRVFFRTTMKQRQVREQLIQTPLPSLLLNGFFVMTAGMYLSFVLQHFNLDPVDNFWLMSLYCSIGLSICYFVKFLGLKVSGWLFNMKEAADSYIFIVFIVNKMAGLLLVPFVVLLAFTKDGLYSVVMSLSWIAIVCLLAYRFILTYATIRNQVKVNPFHFFLYLCAFEIAPLLLVYKGLLLFLKISM